MTTTLNLNGQPVAVNAEPDTPLLWVLRGELQMNGTKFGCGMALCGACTVHLNGEPVRACITPLSAVGNAQVTTIEGLQGPEATALRTASCTNMAPNTRAGGICSACTNWLLVSCRASSRVLPCSHSVINEAAAIVAVSP